MSEGKRSAKPAKPAKGGVSKRKRILPLAKTPSVIGRPSKYTKETCAIATRCIELLLTDEQIQHVIGVSPPTWYRWKHEHPEFNKAVTRTKEETDRVVEASLAMRAMGYSVEAVKVFMVPVTKEFYSTGGKTRAPAKRIVKTQEAVVVPYLEHIPPDVGAAALYLHNRSPDRWKHRGAAAVRTENAADQGMSMTPEEIAERQEAYKRLLQLVEDNARSGGPPIFKPRPLGEPKLIEVVPKEGRPT